MTRVRGLVARGGALRRLGAAGWGQLTAALVSLLALRFYTSRMSATIFGEATLIVGALLFIDGVFTMAFNQTLIMILKDREIRADRVALGLGLGVMFGALMMGITGVLAAGLATAMVAGVATGPLWPLLAAALAYAVAEPVRITGQTVMLLERRFTAMSAWLAVDGVAGVGATLLYFDLVAPTPISLCVGLVAGRLVTTTIFWSTQFGVRLLAAPDMRGARAERARALAFAAPVSVLAPLGWVSLYTDRYVLGFTTGPASAGLLAALAGAVTRPYMIVSATLANVYRPDMLDRAAGRPALHANPLRTWSMVAFALGCAGVVAMLLLGHAISTFLLRFRGDVSAGPTVLVILAISQVFVLLTHAVENQVLALERSRSLLASQAIAVALGVPMIAAGALVDGVIGAAWGRVANEAVKLLLAAYLLRVRPARATIDHDKTAAVSPGLAALDPLLDQVPTAASTLP